MEKYNKKFKEGIFDSEDEPIDDSINVDKIKYNIMSHLRKSGLNSNISQIATAQILELLDAMIWIYSANPSAYKTLNSYLDRFYKQVHR